MTMELFIRVSDGQPVDHPIMGDNFRDAFPHIDVNNLPPEFARFTRVVPPVVSVYEVYEGVTYEFDGSGFTDVHHVRPMTDDEKLVKQNAAKASWVEQKGFPSWVFDEAMCIFKAPVDMPKDGKQYSWDEPNVRWVEYVPHSHT